MKFPVFTIIVAGLLLIGSHVPAYAADEAAPAADAAKPDAKAEEGGAEGGKEGDKAEGGKKKGSGDITGGRFAGDPIYVHLPPLVLPIISQTGVEQLVSLQLAVEVKDYDIGDDIHTNMPRVMDALNCSLYGSLGDGSVTNGGRLVDADKIKAKAMTALLGVVGAGNIKDVLIISLSQRML